MNSVAVYNGRSSATGGNPTSSKHGRTSLTLIQMAVAGALTLAWVRGVTAADCKAAKTQREIEECTTTRLEEVNARLERAYTRYLGALVGEDHDRLVQAEHAWERYRDLDCQAARGMYAGGTMAPTEFAVCKTNLATQRLEDLERIYAEPPQPAGSTAK